MEQKKVKIKINNQQYLVNEGENILHFCKTIGIDIPAFCYHEALKPYGACRLCIVEVKGGNVRPGITTSCTLKASEGLEILTDTEEIQRHRKILFQFYLAQAPNSKVVKDFAAKYGVTDTPFTPKHRENDNLGGECVLCGLCVRVCNEIIGQGVINYTGRGYLSRITTAYSVPNESCLGCKACAEVCPTGAIKFEDLENVRVAKSWSETKIPLKQCKVCGQYYASEPFEDEVLKKMDPQLADELKDMCPSCRRKAMSKKQVAIKEHNFAILNLK